MLGFETFEYNPSPDFSIPGPATITCIRGTAGDQHGGIWGPFGEFIIAFSSGVTANVVASWVWEKIKFTRPTKVVIMEVKVILTEEVIKSLIISEIEKAIRTETEITDLMTKNTPPRKLVGTKSPKFRRSAKKSRPFSPP
jgi:hypothetical protein